MIFKKVSIEIPVELHTDIKIACCRNQVSMTKFLNKCLEAVDIDEVMSQLSSSNEEE